jgi:hypothetical protein
MVSSFYAGKTILLSLAFLVVHFGSEFGSEAQPVAPLPQSEIDALEILFAFVRHYITPHLFIHFLTPTAPHRFFCFFFRCEALCQSFLPIGLPRPTTI